MKKLFTLIFACFISFNAIQAEITWNLSDDGTLTISGTDMPSYSSNSSPWSSQWRNIKNVIIKNGVTNIGSYAFRYCSRLTSITIPNSVTWIAEYAFSDCSGLTSVTIPNSVTWICESAFSGCSGLTSVTIGNSVKIIGGAAFKGCSGLTSLTIPESVTSIGGRAFDVAKLRNIVVKAKTPPSWDKKVENTFSNQTLYHATLMVPEGSWDAYAYSDNWYQFINIREMAYNAVNLTNSKAYMLKSSNEGSYLFYDSVNDCVASLNKESRILAPIHQASWLVPQCT